MLRQQDKIENFQTAQKGTFLSDGRRRSIVDIVDNKRGGGWGAKLIHVDVC